MSSGIILILVGLFSMAGGYFNWNWFMENRRARFFSKILGSRTRGRIFYIVLGTFVIIFGISTMLGFVDLS